MMILWKSTMILVEIDLEEPKRGPQSDPKYDLFKMEDHESVDQMFGRFQTIINNLRHWRAQVTTLKAFKDLKKLPMKELLGTLKIH
ncbi:hypothetical protein CR513_00650, partial [Mucuna pruriens]